MRAKRVFACLISAFLLIVSLICLSCECEEDGRSGFGIDKYSLYCTEMPEDIESVMAMPILDWSNLLRSALPAHNYRVLNKPFLSDDSILVGPYMLDRNMRVKRKLLSPPNHAIYNYDRKSDTYYVISNYDRKAYKIPLSKGSVEELNLWNIAEQVQVETAKMVFDETKTKAEGVPSVIKISGSNVYIECNGILCRYDRDANINKMYKGNFTFAGDMVFSDFDDLCITQAWQDRMYNKYINTRVVDDVLHVRKFSHPLSWAFEPGPCFMMAYQYPLRNFVMVAITGQSGNTSFDIANIGIELNEQNDAERFGFNDNLYGHISYVFNERGTIYTFEHRGPTTRLICYDTQKMANFEAQGPHDDFINVVLPYATPISDVSSKSVIVECDSYLIPDEQFGASINFDCLNLKDGVLTNKSMLSDNRERIICMGIAISAICLYSGSRICIFDMAGKRLAAFDVTDSVESVTICDDGFSVIVVDKDGKSRYALVRKNGWKLDQFTECLFTFERRIDNECVQVGFADNRHVVMKYANGWQHIIDIPSVERQKQVPFFAGIAEKIAYFAGDGIVVRVDTRTGMVDSLNCNNATTDYGKIVNDKLIICNGSTYRLAKDAVTLLISYSSCHYSNGCLVFSKDDSGRSYRYDIALKKIMIGNYKYLGDIGNGRYIGQASDGAIIIAKWLKPDDEAQMRRLELSETLER